MSSFSDLQKAFYLAQQKGDTEHATKFAKELAAQGTDYSGKQVEETNLQAGDTLGGNVWNGNGWVSPDKYDLPLKTIPSTPAVQENKPQSWLKVATRGVSNLPGSIAGVAGDVVSSVLHPIDTAQGVLDLGNATLQKVLPDAIVQMMPESTRNNPVKLNAVVDFYKSRYTNPENFKEALATDPASVLADFSTVLTGGGSLASKIPALTKVGNVVASAGRIVDPLSIAVNAAPSFGKGLANVIGGTGTHTGGEGLKIAARAATEGGKMSETFLGNIFGNVPMQDFVDMAKQNISDMGARRAAAYQQGIVDISNDKSVLDFNKIDNTLANTYDKVTFKGKPKNDVAFTAFNKIANEINAWKDLDPAEYHTPMGLDALKQRIGGIQESIPYEEKTARMVAKNLYDSVKDEITNQAPAYSKVMKDYSQASDLINNLERTFSLKQSGNPDTALRKLQSIMRNNENTNYGNRLDLFKTLEDQGRNELSSAAAGQSLSSWTPRGLANAGLTGIGSYAVGGAPLAVPMLMAQSPKLMGLSAYGVGLLSKPVTKASKKLKGMFDYLNVDPTLTGNLLYQARENRQ